MPGTPESHKTETTESGEPTESTKSPTGTYTCVHILCPWLCSLSFIFNSNINFEKYTMYTNIAMHVHVLQSCHVVVLTLCIMCEWIIFSHPC